MSIPKSVNRTVKRRGLAIATAVAVAGSGIVGVNYASAQDANGGTVTAAEENANQAPDAQKVFDREKETIDARLTETKDPVAVAQEVAGKYKEQFSGDEVAFGQFEYQLEQKVKRHFTERVHDNAIDLGDQYTLPTWEEAFKKDKETKIKSRLIETKNPEQVAKEIANQYLAGFADIDEYNKFEYKIEQETKKYFSTLVADGEVELDSDFTTPSPKDYFESREALIEAELRSGNVEEVVNKHAELVYKQPGSNLHDEADKTAWKNGFRPLVEVKKEKLELDAKAAELKKQQAEFDEELKKLQADFEKLDKLNNELEQKAKDQNARDSELDAKAAELKKQQAEFDEKMKQHELDIEKLNKLNNELEQKAKDQSAKESELKELAEKLKKQEEALDAKSKELQSQSDKLQKLNNELEQKAKDQSAKESELKELAEKLKKQEEALDAKSKELQSQSDKLQKLNKELEQKAKAQSAKESELSAQEAKLKQQRDELTAKAEKLASELQRLEQLKKELDKANQDNGDNKEQPKPGLLDGSSNWWNPSGASDSAKGIFGIAAGVGALGLLFGGLLQIVNYFTGAGHVQAQVRDALAKIGIRF